MAYSSNLERCFAIAQAAPEDTWRVANGYSAKDNSAAKSIIGGAAVGGVIAGPAGAIVGAMVGKEKHRGR